MNNFKFFKHLSETERIKRRFTAIVLGNIIMSFATSLLRLSLFGNDPFSCMNLGYSIFSGLSFGQCVITYNCILIIFVFILDKSFINVGTLINMFLFGPCSDFFYNIIVFLLGSTFPLSVRTVLLLSGVLISCFGNSAYMCSNLGMGPYDVIGWLIEKKTHKKVQFRYARIGWDFCAVVIGFTLGSIVGLGTLIMAFFTGPLITFFNNKINIPIIYGQRHM